MIILGLTGGIAMGKSTVSGMFRAAHVPVFDADAAVHAEMAPGGAAVDAVTDAFGRAVLGEDGGVDRQALGAIVFQDANALKRLEAILHPRVYAAEGAFLAARVEAGAPLVVLDIPLLFETGGERRCDVTATVSVPAAVQHARALARPGMSEAKLAAILAKQVPDSDRRARADYIIPSETLAEAQSAVTAIIDDLAARPPGLWPDGYRRAVEQD